MQTINIRNLFNLHGYKIILFLFIGMLFAAPVNAQKRSKANYNYFLFKQKPYYFGLTLGSNSSRFSAFRSKEYIFSDSISSVRSVSGPGFNLGIVTNLKIGEYFDFRFLPTLSFAERTLNYTKNSRFTPKTQKKLESIFVEMPFHFRFKSAPYRDKRLFVVAGVKYAFDVASKARATSEGADQIIKISPHDFSFEVGAGMQIFFPYFIFSPEIKMSYGIGNTLLFNPNLEESSVLDKILSRTFTISFNFEG